MSTAGTARTRERPAEAARSGGSATRVAVSTFGVLAGLAGIEHGVGEMLQGSVRPEGAVIESWPDWEAMEVLNGEPAMTVVPNLLVTEVLAVVAAVALAAWSIWFIDRRRGGLVLLLLSMLLLLVGGGFGPPLVGIIAGIGATRMRAASGGRPARVWRAAGAAWPWALGAAVAGYLSLVPGTVLLSEFWGVESAGLVAALSLFSFAALILALAAARAHDRMQAARAQAG